MEMASGFAQVLGLLVPEHNPDPTGGLHLKG